MKKILLRTLCLIFILSACSPQKSTTTAAPTLADMQPTATAIPSPTTSAPDVVVTHPELEVISPENIGRLEQIASWGEGSIYDYAVSPDRSLIAVSTARTIFLLDSQDLSAKQQITREDFPKEIAGNPIIFSPDGTSLVYATNNVVYRLDIATGVTEYKGVSVLDDLTIRSLSVSPDNSTIAVLSYGGYNACDGAGGNISVYGFAKYMGSPYFSDFFCHPSMASISYTKSGLGYVFYANALNNDVPVLDLNTHRVSKYIDLGEIALTESILEISPDGKTIAVGSYNGGPSKVKIIDINTHKVLQELDGSLQDLEYSEVTRSWNMDSLSDQVLESCGTGVTTNNYLHVIRKNDSSKTATVITKDSEFQVWDIASCTKVKEFDPIEAKTIKVSPDNTLLAVQDTSHIHLMDLVTGEVRYTFEFDGVPGLSILKDYGFSPDGVYLIAGTSQKDTNNHVDLLDVESAIYLWNLNSGKLVKKFSLGESLLYEVDAGSGDGVIAIRTRDGVELWNYLKEELFYDLPGGTVLYAKDGTFILMDLSSTIYQYDISSGQVDKISIRPNEISRVLSVNPQRQTLTAILKDGNTYPRIAQFDIITGSLLTTQNTEFVDRVISGNDSKFFILYEDGTFDLWDADTIQLVNHFSGYRDITNLKDNSPGDSDVYRFSGFWSCAVDDAVISLNSDFVITYNYCDGLRIWDASTNDNLGDIPLNYMVGQLLTLRGFLFNPDGRLITLLGDDGIIRLWGVRAEQ